MKNTFLLSLLLFIGLNSFSQTMVEAKNQLPAVEASYVGGSDALNKFIATNVKYPKNSKSEGKVYVEIFISETGEVKNVIVLKSLNKEMDEISVNAIKKMPKWTPAQDEKGNPIASTMILPINFKK